MTEDEWKDKRIQQLEQERDELKAHCERLRGLLLPAKTVHDCDGDLWCVIDPEDCQYVLSETPTQSLAEIKNNLRDELIFVGYTNGAQIFYASDETAGGAEGAFFKTHEHGCHIPLYMLKTHQHRIETTTEGEVTIDLIKAAQKR